MIDSMDENPESVAPDVMLLDVNVPRKDGSQVLERVRRSPRCAKVPVVMISSSDSAAERKRALDLGATEYFRKPSNLDEFMLLGQLVRKLHEQNDSPA